MALVKLSVTALAYLEKARENLTRMKERAVEEQEQPYPTQHLRAPKSELKYKMPPASQNLSSHYEKRAEREIVQRSPLIETKRQAPGQKYREEEVIVEEREPNTTNMTFQESDNSVLEIKHMTEQLTSDSRYPFSAFLKN